MTAEQIEAASHALSRFGIIELVILGIIGVAVLVIIFLGKKLIDVWMAKINSDSQQTLKNLDSEHTKIETETNSCVNDIANRLTPLEENVVSLQKKTEVTSIDIENIKKCLAHDIENIKQQLDEDKAERKDRQIKFDNELDSIKSNMKNMSSILSDHEEFQEKLSEGTLENMLFNDNNEISIFKKLKSYLRLLAMKKNGRIKEKGFKLILANKDIWLTILEVLPAMKLNILDQAYFDSVLDEINNRIFDGTMR